MELDADRPRGAVPRPPISFIVAALLEVSGGRALAAPYIAAIDWILMACWALALGGTFALTAGAVELLCPSYRTLRGKNGTRTAYLIGYEASCLLSNFYLATAGAIAWFFLDLDAALHAEIPFAVVHILYPMLAHLISDLAIAVFLPEVREPAIIVHVNDCRRGVAEYNYTTVHTTVRSSKCHVYEGIGRGARHQRETG